MYETPINRQVTSFFATQIVVLNVDGSSPSGHPRAEKLENAGNPCKSAGFPVFHRQEFDFHFWFSVPNLGTK